MIAESMWEIISSWFTPTTLLFLLLNFTIVTIYLTSASSQKSPASPSSPSSHIKSDSNEELHRTTSVLQRLKSINFYHFPNYHTSHESPVAQSQITPVEIEPVVYESNEAENRFEEDEKELLVIPSDEVEDRFDDEIEIGGEKSLDEVYSQLQRGSHNRSKSDMDPASGVVAVKLVKKMKKSASSKSAFRHFKEEEILEARRPATVKEPTVKEATEDEEVDSKADDFINKFKQQLQLQRLDSILRYKEMLGRGAR